MLDEVAGKEHTGLHAVVLDIADHRLTVHALLTGHKEAEPARVRIRLRLRQDQLRSCSALDEERLQQLEVVLPACDEARELFELCDADRRLHIGSLQIIAEMAVDILVVIALRKLAILSVEAVVAGIIVSRCAPAVTAPVTDRAHDAVKLRVVRIAGAALAHRHVVWRVEAGGTDVADRAGLAGLAVDRIGRAERITVVLHEPELVPVAEILHRLQIKRIAEGMCDHHGLRLLGVCFLELRHIDIAGRQGHIHEDRNRTVLDDRVHGRREAGRHGDHLISALHAALAEQRARQCTEGQQIRAGAGVHEAHITYAEVLTELLLEGVGVASGGQPELERTVYEIHHLLVVIDTAGIRDALALMVWLLHRCDLIFSCIFCDEIEDFLSRLLLCFLCHVLLFSLSSAKNARICCSVRALISTPSDHAWYHATVS